ncbi:aminotransferase class V-fold PLP-dependent enzyme [Kitasatospora sp. NPDC002227]|uniref:aminotransferase class V-fold PLP-dependent enzyme n=1 Tax=Kitasatospora sp. NPDC002227 TaxID=3154773 RepID=UPI0033233D78
MTAAATGQLAGLRAEEFPYLDAAGQAYLDYTGAALPPLSLVRGSAERLARGVYGNPHSASPASLASTELVAEARRAVLAFCRAPAEQYAVVFTPNATGAIRLVAEAFPFAPGRGLALLRDNHNSVLGLRCYATAAGAPVRVLPLGAEHRADAAAVAAALAAGPPGLFAYPGQSNATGVRHPLSWVAEARRQGWRVLLDAAAMLPTAGLDLGAVPADFVALSWYKITGFPSGVGCLLARHEALAELHRPWFSGGTVQATAADPAWYLLSPPPDGFEDGSLAFLALPDVIAAAGWHGRIGYPALAAHTGALTRRLIDGLTALRHPGGEPAARVLGPTGPADRGPTVAFHLLRPDGTPLDERLAQAATAAAGISVRTGCFCNPGVTEQDNGLTPDRVAHALRAGDPASTDAYLRQLGGRVQGSVRASTGAATVEADVDRLLTVCAELAARAPADPAEPRHGC